MPGKNGIFMIIDAGANVDLKPENMNIKFFKKD
jgi:fatty acid/phospholipid biosynthesis enzyme